MNSTEVLSNLAQSNQLTSVIILLAYLVLAYFRGPLLLLAFSVSCMLFEMSLFNPLSESELYCITFTLYSYVALCNGLTLKTRLACVTILILCIIMGYDAYYYGVGGVYGATKTFVYNNLENSAVVCHSIVISSFVDFTRVKLTFRRFIDSTMHLARNSVNFVLM